MPCPKMVGCPMFPVFTLKSSLRVWQARYCESNFEECMRYRLQRSGTCAPPNLLPNGKHLDAAQAAQSAESAPPAPPASPQR